MAAWHLACCASSCGGDELDLGSAMGSTARSVRRDSRRLAVQDFTHRAATVCTLSLLVLALRAGSTPVPLASPDPIIRPAAQAAPAVVTKAPAPQPAAVHAQLTTLPLLF